MKGFARALATMLAAAALAAPAAALAQGSDPSTRLRAVLPAAVAERVLDRIAEARAAGLPADALEQRALKFAAKGVSPADIERSVGEHATRLRSAKDVLDRTRRRRASGDEVEAGAEVLRLGVTGASVADLARSAPSGRSLAVPLYVLGSLVSRGLPADEALASVRTRLLGRATDAEIEQLGTTLEPGQGAGLANRPAGAGTRGGGRPEGAGVGAGAGAATRGGPPAGVPRNGGAKAPAERPGKGGGRKP